MRQILLTACFLMASLSADAQMCKPLEEGMILFDMSINENKNWTFNYADRNMVKPKESGFKDVLSYEQGMSMESTDGECKVYANIEWIFRASLDKWEEGYEDCESQVDVIKIFRRKTNKPSKDSFGWAKLYLFGGSYGPTTDYSHIRKIATFYPKKRAKKLFNADYMMSVPMDTLLEDKKIQGKYSHLCFVVLGKYECDVHLIFCMTDKGLQDFDKYLNRMKRVFWFNWKG